MHRSGRARKAMEMRAGTPPGAGRDAAFRPVKPPGMLFPPDGGLGTQDGPAWVGHLLVRAATGSSKKKRSILRPRVSFSRRPRTGQSFHAPVVGSAAGVQVVGVRPRSPEMTLSLGRAMCRHTEELSSARESHR